MSDELQDKKRSLAAQVKDKADELNMLIRNAAVHGLYVEIDVLPLQIITAGGTPPKCINVCVYDKL